MAIYTIGDLHLSLGGDKAMDVFPRWSGYVQRLEQNWRRLVQPEDTVVLAGDTSWAMKLEDTLADFDFLQRLPGQKLLLKGNHDYWWGTMARMERFVAENGFDSLHFLHNNSYEKEGIALCGTRGWMFEPDEERDEKVMRREVGRLRASLAAAGCAEKLVFLHYPPLSAGERAPELIDAMREHGVKRCFYGHLHSAAIRWAVQGDVEGITYKLISADSLDFMPYLVANNGA